MISANISNSKRKAVYRRDGYRCALCDYSQHLQLHHVIPRGHGGPDSPQNLITLCAECHALAHGFDLRGLDDPPTQEGMTQACIEYLSDLYAAEGKQWNPWGPDQDIDGNAPARDKDPQEERARETARIIKTIDTDEPGNAQLLIHLAITAEDGEAERVDYYLSEESEPP